MTKNIGFIAIALIASLAWAKPAHSFFTCTKSEAKNIDSNLSSQGHSKADFEGKIFVGMDSGTDEGGIPFQNLTIPVKIIVEANFSPKACGDNKIDTVNATLTTSTKNFSVSQETTETLELKLYSSITKKNQTEYRYIISSLPIAWSNIWPLFSNPAYWEKEVLFADQTNCPHFKYIKLIKRNKTKIQNTLEAFSSSSDEEFKALDDAHTSFVIDLSYADLEGFGLRLKLKLKEFKS